MRIVVTRAADAAGELAGRLEQLGHEVVHCPLIRVEPLGDGPVDVSGYDWVIVTSAFGARELRRRMAGRRRKGCSPRCPPSPAASCSPAPRAPGRCSPTSCTPTSPFCTAR